jgi:hypothetical protein
MWARETRQDDNTVPTWQALAKSGVICEGLLTLR